MVGQCTNSQRLLPVPTLVRPVVIARADGHVPHILLDEGSR
jgi:hypothetical protein